MIDESVRVDQGFAGSTSPVAKQGVNICLVELSFVFIAKYSIHKDEKDLQVTFHIATSKFREFEYNL